MKTKIFFMAALALMTAACSNDDSDFMNPAQQPANGEITITAQLAPKTDGAATRAVSEGTDKIVAAWAEGEHIAILYEVSGTKYEADAEITEVDGWGTASITFTVLGTTPDDTACTLVYPRSAAKDDHSGVKDAATLLAAQDGTLNANLDVRVGEGTIQTSTPSLTVTTQPVAQFAIFKYTLSGTSIDATHPLVIKDGSEKVITSVTPASSATSVYAAMPAAASSTYKFIVTTDDNKYIKSGTAAITAGKYYQTPLEMTARYPLGRGSATVDDIGSVIASDHKIYLNVAAASAAGETAIAVIAYMGYDNGESSPNNHGLALALSDASDGCMWKTTETDAGHTKQTDPNYNFTPEGGLQYINNAHNSDDYPAFKAAINYSATGNDIERWFLPTAYQWQQMINAAGGASNLANMANLATDNGSYYWSSSEYSGISAWRYTFYDRNWVFGNKTTTGNNRVRACFAF